METSILYVIKALILPPGLNIVLILIGLILLNRYKKIGSFFILLSALSLYLLSTSFISLQLAGLIETSRPLSPIISSDTDRQAIVLLGGGSYMTMPEYGKPVPYSSVLERIRYALYLQRLTNLPILITGGKVFPTSHSEAWIINQVMIDDFQYEAKWLEEKSRNTAENAEYSFEILKSENIDRIFLVTHATHMTRAEKVFKSKGFDVIPAPTIFLPKLNDMPLLMQLLPTTISLTLSRDVLHEIMGQWWYQLRHQ